MYQKWRSKPPRLHTIREGEELNLPAEAPNQAPNQAPAPALGQAPDQTSDQELEQAPDQVPEQVTEQVQDNTTSSFAPSDSGPLLHHFPIPIQKAGHRLSIHTTNKLLALLKAIQPVDCALTRPQAFIPSSSAANTQLGTPSYPASGLSQNTHSGSIHTFNPLAPEFVPQQVAGSATANPSRPSEAQAKAEYSFERITRAHRITHGRDYAATAALCFEPEYLKGQELFDRHQSTKKIVAKFPSDSKLSLPSYTYTGSGSKLVSPAFRLTDSQVWSPPPNSEDLVLQYLDSRGLHTSDSLLAELKEVGLRQ